MYLLASINGASDVKLFPPSILNTKGTAVVIMNYYCDGTGVQITHKKLVTFIPRQRNANK